MANCQSNCGCGRKGTCTRVGALNSLCNISRSPFYTGPCPAAPCTGCGECPENFSNNYAQLRDAEGNCCGRSGCMNCGCSNCGAREGCGCSNCQTREGCGCCPNCGAREGCGCSNCGAREGCGCSNCQTREGCGCCPNCGAREGCGCSNCRTREGCGCSNCQTREGCGCSNCQTRESCGCSNCGARGNCCCSNCQTRGNCGCSNCQTREGCDCCSNYGAREGCECSDCETRERRGRSDCETRERCGCCSDCGARESRETCGRCERDSTASGMFVSNGPIALTAGECVPLTAGDAAQRDFGCGQDGGIRIQRSGVYFAALTVDIPAETAVDTKMRIEVNGRMLSSPMLNVAAECDGTTANFAGHALFYAQAGAMLRVVSQDALAIPRASSAPVFTLTLIHL